MTYDDMPAGIDMDLAIGRLLGYEFREFPGFPGRYHITGNPFFNDTVDWSPSTNIAHAFEVIEDTDAVCDIILWAVEDGWCCALDFDALSAGDITAADTAPLAICRAALKACQ